MKNEWNIDLYINASKYMQDLYKHLTTHNDFSAHYIRCFFQHCFFLEMEFAGIFSAVLKENVSEMDLETVNEETDFSLQIRGNDTNLWNILPL